MTAAPLSGVAVVSMAQNVPGPVAVAHLVAEGAGACKIEPPSGDPLAAMCASWYAELHEGVDVRRLDLKAAPGAAALQDRLADADLFVSSHRPSALIRLGLDGPTLARRFPRLRILNIVGDTAHPEEAGHDVTYQAHVGLLGQGLPQTLLADLFGAERAFGAALLLLRGAGGVWRQVGLLDTLADAAAPLRHRLTSPGGELGGANPCYGVYAAADGHIAVAALEPHFRARLYAALDLPDGSDLAGVWPARTAREWEGWARDKDIPLVALRPHAWDTTPPR